MINKKKLILFYTEQYEQAGRKKPKKPPRYSDMDRKAEALRRVLRNAKPSRVNIRSLEDLHRQLKNLAGYAYRRNRDNIKKLLNEELLPKLVQLDLGMLVEDQ